MQNNAMGLSETSIVGALLTDEQRQALIDAGQAAIQEAQTEQERFKRTGTASIKVRRPNFEPEKITRHFFKNGSPLLSHFITALSSTFPIGEQFFVHSVRNIRDKIQDPQLAAEITAFIGQEAMHSLAHDQYNRSWRKDDYNLDKFIGWLASQDKRLKKVPYKYQLAVTVAFEHYTAMFGEYFLNNIALVKGFDENVARLWVWHAIEEIEHKSVAFDAYQAVFADLAVRRRVMTAATISFAGIIVRSTAMLFWQDRKASLPKVKENMRDLYLVARMVVALIPELAAFYKKDFHPAQRDNTKLLHYWRDRLEQGTLLDNIEKVV